MTETIHRPAVAAVAPPGDCDVTAACAVLDSYRAFRRVGCAPLQAIRLAAGTYAGMIADSALAGEPPAAMAVVRYRAALRLERLIAARLRSSPYWNAGRRVGAW